MARIDPRLQQRLNAAVAGFAESLRRVEQEIREAALDVHDLALDLDESGRKVGERIAEAAIEKARK